MNLATPEMASKSRLNAASKGTVESVAGSLCEGAAEAVDAAFDELFSAAAPDAVATATDDDILSAECDFEALGGPPSSVRDGLVRTLGGPPSSVLDELSWPARAMQKLTKNGPVTARHSNLNSFI